MQLLASKEGLIKQMWIHDNTVARRLDLGNNLSRYTIPRTITKRVQHKCSAQHQVFLNTVGLTAGTVRKASGLLLRTFFISWIWGTVSRPTKLLIMDWTVGSSIRGRDSDFPLRHQIQKSKRKGDTVLNSLLSSWVRKSLPPNPFVPSRLVRCLTTLSIAETIYDGW